MLYRVLAVEMNKLLLKLSLGDTWKTWVISLISFELRLLRNQKC